MVLPSEEFQAWFSDPQALRQLQVRGTHHSYHEMNWSSASAPSGSGALSSSSTLRSECPRGRAQTQAAHPRTRVLSCPRCCSRVRLDLPTHCFSQRGQTRGGQSEGLPSPGSCERRKALVSLRSPSAASPWLPLCFPFPQLSSLAAKRKSTLFTVTC